MVATASRTSGSPERSRSSSTRTNGRVAVASARPESPDDPSRVRRPWRSRSRRRPPGRCARSGRVRPRRARGRRRGRHPLIDGHPGERSSSRSAQSASRTWSSRSRRAPLIATTEAAREARRCSTRLVRRTIPGRTGGRKSLASVTSNPERKTVGSGGRLPRNLSDRPTPHRRPDQDTAQTVPRGSFASGNRWRRAEDRRRHDVARGRTSANHPHRTTTPPRCGAMVGWPRSTCAPSTEGERWLRPASCRTRICTQMLELVKDADSVELKLTIPESARAGTARALGVDPLDAQMRQVFFFDTPELALNAAGMVVRARRRQGEQGDTVVKLRPVVPSDLPDDLRASSSFNVEVDAMPGGFVCSASFKGVADNAAIREAAAGTGRSASSSRRSSGRSTRRTRRRGSSSTRSRSSDRSRSQGEGRPEGLRAPAGRRAVDVSGRIADRRAVDQEPGPTRCSRSRRRRRAFLHSHGVDLSAEQQTKTKTALEFFSGAMEQA